MSAPPSSSPPPRTGAERPAPAPESRLHRLAVSVLRIAVVAYVGITALLYFFQSKFVYHPFADIEATPRDNGMAYEDLSFQTADGLTLNAWYVPAENSRGVVLFCHGNAGNISHRLESLHLWHSLGLDVLIFDYRGYGRSQGKPSEQGTHLDAQAAWDYLVSRRNVPPERIIIFGRSLGGSVAAHLAAQHPPKGLILESAFTSIPDLAGDLYWFLPVRLLARFQYNTLEAVRKVRCPVLVIHSREDDLIPFKHGQRLFEAAGEPKRFVEMRGGHNEGWMVSLYDGYRDALERFRSECFPPSTKPASQPAVDPG